MKSLVILLMVQVAATGAPAAPECAVAAPFTAGGGTPGSTAASQALARGRTAAALHADATTQAIVVHYGLNDSHSHSWVRETLGGVVGMSYFQRFPGDYTDGLLLYRTISPCGAVTLDTVTTGTRLEKSVLLYDASALPHIFVARSSDVDQVIDHYSRGTDGAWQCDTIVQFENEGGKFIYELSADSGPDHSFHLLVLKTRSNIDSSDFMDAWMGANLFYLTNAPGYWTRELIRYYDMAYTYDMYIKSSCRQDIRIDDAGAAHVVFSEQVMDVHDPSRLLYATNRFGTWQTEVALNYEPATRDDAGWFPSLCLDRDGTPHVSCMYVDRVHTGSATACTLLLLRRLGEDDWASEVVATQDDGYYGGDGRNYTGGLTHLVFDRENRPHILFSDIASTHWPESQRLNVGNVRMAVRDNGAWNFSTVYRQPRPSGFYDAAEMFGTCLNVSDSSNTVRVVGVELVVSGEYVYTCELLDFAWPKDSTAGVPGEGCGSLPPRLELGPNRPNPFARGTLITFRLPREARVTVSVYDVLGQLVAKVMDGRVPAGEHSVAWDGRSGRGAETAPGVYFCRVEADDQAGTIRMVLLR